MHKSTINTAKTELYHYWVNVEKASMLQWELNRVDIS